MKIRLAGAIGMAKKAGAVISGTDLVIDAVRRNKARLVIIAADISESTTKKITDKCAFYNTEVLPADLLMTELAGAIGLHRAVATIAITDKNFIHVINKVLNTIDPEVHAIHAIKPNNP